MGGPHIGRSARTALHDQYVGGRRPTASCKLPMDLYAARSLLDAEDLHSPDADPARDYRGTSAGMGYCVRTGPRWPRTGRTRLSGGRDLQYAALLRSVRHAEASRFVQRSLAARRFQMASVQRRLELGG